MVFKAYPLVAGTFFTLNIGGIKLVKSDFVLECMENEKYDFFLEINKIRPLLDMDLLFYFYFRNLLVDS